MAEVKDKEKNKSRSYGTGKFLLDPDFKYDPAAVSKDASYLARKWSRLYPGWNKPKRTQNKGR